MTAERAKFFAALVTAGAAATLGCWGVAYALMQAWRFVVDLVAGFAGLWM